MRQCLQFQQAPPTRPDPAPFLCVSIKDDLLILLTHSQPSEHRRSEDQRLQTRHLSGPHGNCSDECRYLCVCSPGCFVKQFAESALTVHVTESRGRGSRVGPPASPLVPLHTPGPLGRGAPLRAPRELQPTPGGSERSKQPEATAGPTHVQERLPPLRDQILPHQQSQWSGPRPQDKGPRLRRLDGLWPAQCRGVRVPLLKARLAFSLKPPELHSPLSPPNKEPTQKIMSPFSHCTYCNQGLTRLDPPE